MKIDGIDIKEYGITAARGHVSSLLSYPDMRSPDSQEWAEYDGVEVDLSDPKLKERSIDISFSADSIESAESFIARLSATGYRNVEIPLLDKSWRLRYVSQSEPELYSNGAVFTVKFADDFPLIPNALRSGHGIPVPPTSKYYIDGVNLSEYGLLVLQAKPSLYKAPELRESLKVTNNVMNGVIYDVDMANFKPKDVTFRMAFYVDSISRLMRNHAAFFNALTAPDERVLSSSYMIEEPKFYYKSASNFEFSYHDTFSLLEFDLTMVFTSSRPSLLDILLATEIWELVVTEDGVSFIDLSPN